MPEEFTVPPATPGEEPCTDKQVHFLLHLYPDFEEPQLRALGKWQASALIEELLERQRAREGVDIYAGTRPYAAAAPVPQRRERGCCASMAIGCAIVFGIGLLLVSILFLLAR